MSLSWLPNALCVLRMCLAVPSAWFLYHQQFVITFAVFFVAAITDGLDGFIAKRFNWTSDLGKLLDPLADKLLLVTVFITLAVIGKVALWLVILVVARDLVIIIGAMVFRRLFGPLIGAAPTLISKINTVVQIVFVLAVMLVAISGNTTAASIVTVLGYVAAVTIIVSGLDYTLTYSKRAAEIQRARSGARNQI